MNQFSKTLFDYIVLIVVIGLFGLGYIYILIDWIFGSRCPKCKKRGLKKFDEVCMDNNFDTSTSRQYFVSYKCNKCGYSKYNYESRGDSTSG